ncbi:MULTISPECIES: trans-sulfuration enzyme family protein [Gemella]|uniref:trans-sulfuration enzyme family protein n=1 Tax=Gemella TaxID=1378 RepID=UPI0007682243|nr:MULTISPECIES: PLP-dependent aspartate aminotransferase family protein [Gemella]AME09864.1 cystathionine gamma-synthase [Gemella sp. oral taxon 928]AXI26003.1 PLP-dependent transferase [Gemella sp. ND 6198]
MKGVNTNLLHGYPVIDNYTGAASIPKYQTSTFDQKDFYTDGKKYCYSRFANPTIVALQKAIEKLENAKYGFAFSSGMAAITTALMTLKTGEHIILPIEVYGGTYQFCSEILPRYGIETTFTDYSNLNNVEKHIKDNTKIIYIETPSNPLLKISDIIEIVKLAKKNNIRTIADNTFMTPIYQKPLELGCDIVVESMTKFINGHSDVVAGAIATNNEEIAKEICLLQKNFGGIMGVEDAWLTLRGMKTMGLRMEKSVTNALSLAEFLEKQEKIKKVYYPELTSCQYFDIHSKQASSGGAVLSFDFYSKEDMDSFLEKITIPIFAVSLGGVESIISHPATMSHACMSKEDRLAQGVTDTLLRLSCGVEDLEDLVEDLEQALK